MKKGWLALVFGMAAPLAVSQNFNDHNLYVPPGVNVLLDSVAGLPHSGGFNYSPPWSQYQTDNLLFLTSPDVLKQESPLFNSTQGGIHLLNSSQRAIYPHFGGFFQINSDVIFTPVNRVILRIGGRMVRLDTPEQSQSQSQMQYGFSSSLGYSFANWFMFRLYAQRLWSLQPDRVSPFLILNPLFPHTGVGAEVSGKIKNVQMGVGTKTIFDSYNNSSQHLNLINTKISIGF